jgi:hypothetical protein
MRVSTWEAVLNLPNFDEMNEKFGLLLEMALTPYHYAQICTDPSCFDRAGYMDVCYAGITEGLRAKWSGEKTMRTIGEDIEELLDELGIMRPDLRQYAVREPWRED